MANVKISGLPSASTPLTGAELVPVVQGGVTSQTTLAAMPYVPTGTGAVTTTVQAKLRETVSVKDFGAKGTGLVDDSDAISLAFAASNSVFFPDGTYLMNSGVTALGNDIEVNFGNAKIINGGANYLFTFGTQSNTYSYTGLKITGGYFEQSNSATSNNYNYILITSIQDFVVRDCVMKNVSNGGITVYAGSQNGVIDGVKIHGKTNYSTCRGIWLQGSTATDFSDQYVDTNSITRNSTAFPIYAIKDVKIVNCTVVVANYGVYLMNAWDCTIDNCYIDASGVGSTRCIALNNYSPRARVTNCTLISDRSCTGILITQCSNDVIVSNNVFRGSFGGNRAVYVAYLASALITSNRFTDTTTQHIQIDMGGFAHVKNNEFVRDTKTNDNRAVYLTGIDTAASAGATGNTGTVLTNSGVVFENNLLNNVCLGVYVDTTIAASNSNQPAPQFAQVANNTFMNMVSLTPSEWPLLVSSSTTGSNVINLRCEKNVLYPYTASGSNRANVLGTNYILEATTASLASFLVDVPSGGTPITSTRQAGNNFSLGTSLSGLDLILVPRTQLGASGASIPAILGIVDAEGTVVPRTYFVRKTGSNYTVSAYNSAGTQLSFTTGGIKFYALLGPINVGT